MRAEARGLNLGRTSWHYDEVDVRPQRARRRLGGARVLARKLRVEPCPTFRRRGLCDECQPRCGATPFEPRPVSTVPEWSRLSGTHSRPGQSRQRKRVARRRRLRRGRFEAKMARPPPCFADRARRGLLPFREEQEVSPLPRPEQATSGRQPLESRAARPLPLSNDQRPGNCRWSRRPAPRRPPAAPRRRPMITNSLLIN